jgi:uncharacterized membrane protein YeaQ/YmgE (transglycosylase-associated protein family)
MKRIVLSALNAPLFVLLVALGVALQSSLFYSYPLLYLQPDVILLAVIWCGLNRGFTEGGVLTLIFSNLAEVHSGAPSGLFFVSYMTIYLLIRVMARYFVMNETTGPIFWTLILSVIWKLVGLLVLHFLNLEGNQWRHTLTLLLPGAVMEAVVGIWVYQGLRKFDWVTFKSAESRQNGEDELQLELEGY